MRVFDINGIVFHQYSNSLIDKMMQFKISQYKVKQQKKKKRSSVFQMNTIKFHIFYTYTCKYVDFFIVKQTILISFKN